MYFSHIFMQKHNYNFLITHQRQQASVQRFSPVFCWPWPTCLNSAVLFCLPCLLPSSSVGVSLIFSVTVLTQHFLSLGSLLPQALTASFGQCPSLFASPSHFGNPGMAGNHWWIRMMRSLSLLGLPLPRPRPLCPPPPHHPTQTLPC